MNDKASYPHVKMCGADSNEKIKRNGSLNIQKILIKVIGQTSYWQGCALTTLAWSPPSRKVPGSIPTNVPSLTCTHPPATSPNPLLDP